MAQENAATGTVFKFLKLSQADRVVFLLCFIIMALCYTVLYFKGQSEGKDRKITQQDDAIHQLGLQIANANRAMSEQKYLSAQILADSTLSWERDRNRRINESLQRQVKINRVLK